MEKGFCFLMHNSENEAISVNGKRAAYVNSAFQPAEKP